MMWCVAREAAIWELEERQLKEKYQLAQQQLKDMFFLKRHQMTGRHEQVGVIDLYICAEPMVIIMLELSVFILEHSNVTQFL